MANDVAIAEVQVTNGVTSCVAGTMVDVGLKVVLQSNASNRYDIGVFVAKDGRPPELSTGDGGSRDCAVFGVPTGPSPLANLNGNVCGDIERSTRPAVVDLGIVSVLCVPDQSGNLKLPSTVTWEQNANGPCQAPPAAWVEAGSPSKCNAAESINVPIQVVGRIVIDKKTEPAAAAGAFPFAASGATPGNFSLSHGQQQILTTGPLTSASPISVTVTEASVPGFDPVAEISCATADGGPADFVSIDRTNRRIVASMTAADSRLNCTFTNKAESRIRVVKTTIGGDAPFPFTGAGRDFTITTVAGTGEYLLSGLSAGRFPVTEIVPDGWRLSAIDCVDPTGGTIVNVAAATATVDLALGETVVCTFTDEKQAAPTTGIINIVKKSEGGDGAFAFNSSVPGAPLFSLRTSAGTSPTRSFTGLAAGIYSVRELVPSGWALTAIACSDPGGNSIGDVAGATATIDLAPGETVTCTFTDAKKGSVVVEKRTEGGDGTFGFIGTSPFSITTSLGYGRDGTTFASVPSGTTVSFSETVPAGWQFVGATCRDTATNASVGTPVPNGRALVVAAGQQVICTVNNRKLAQLEIAEVSQPKDPQAFAFTATGPGLSDFALADDGSGTNRIVFPDLVPGQPFTVTQAAVPGWRTTYIACSDFNASDPGHRTPVDIATRSIAPNLQPGEKLRCGFANVKVLGGVLAGAITISKAADGGDDAFAFANSGGIAASPTNPDSFTITTASGVGSRSLEPLGPGTYTITESVPAGWLSPPSVQCAVIAGTSTTITTVANGVTIALGQTGTAVDRVDCTFANTKAARLTVVEDAMPDSPQVFSYAGEGPGLPAGFTLVNDGSPAPGERVVFPNLVAGSYAVTSTVPAGWHLESISCVGTSDGTIDLATGRAQGNLKPGDDVTCTFRHQREGTITVTKSAPAAAPSETFAFSGPAGLDGDYAPGQTKSLAVAPGTYAVAEIVPDGWRLSNIACAGGTVQYTGATIGATPGFEPGDTTAEIVIAAGESVACTYDNTALSGAIVVTKRAVGGAGIFAFTGVEDFQIDTRLGRRPTHIIIAPAGTHAVREVVPVGWRLTDLQCSGNSSVNLATATATVTLAGGERVDCTFTDEALGRIEIVKEIRGETTSVFTFVAPPTLDPRQLFTLSPSIESGRESRVFESVLTGDYLITENGPPNGFRLQSITCDDPTGDSRTNLADGGALVKLSAGESVTCTFTNATTGTISLGTLSAFGQGQFGYRLTNFPTANEASIATSPVTENLAAGQVRYGNLPPTTYVIAAQPAPAGWRFLYAQCTSNSNEQHWTIAGTTITIDLPDGEAIGCYYVYAPLVGPPTDPFPIPANSVLGAALLALSLLGAGWFRLRRR